LSGEAEFRNILGALLKPSLFPFVFLGIRSASWWAAVGLGGVLSIAMLPAWMNYITVMSNLLEGGVLYSIHNVPLLLVPLVARASSERSDLSPTPR
jgi:hypothetical protein